MAEIGCGGSPPVAQENLNRILLFQKRVLRVKLKLRWGNSVRETFAELGIFTVFGFCILPIIFAKNNFTLLPTLGYYHIIQQEINKGLISPPILT